MRFAKFTHRWTGRPHLVALDQIAEVGTDNFGTYVRLIGSKDPIVLAGTIEEAMTVLEVAKRTYTVFGWVTKEIGRERFIGTLEKAKEAAKYGEVIPVYTMEEDDA